jgi:hypothetical protein
MVSDGASRAVRLRDNKAGSRMNAHTGDVVELIVDGVEVTALVLLATPEAVILDQLDGSTPFVLRPEELGVVRVFDGAHA